MVVILKCDCENDFQDKKYGNKKRVHNTMAKDGYARCTVCSKENLTGKKKD